MEFKKNHDFEKRLSESQQIMKKYPGRLPIIVEKYKNSRLNDIDKTKFLVSKELKMSQFLFIIRKRIKISSSESIFLFIGENGQLCPSATEIGDIYENYSDKDGFLYLTYANENTFG